MAVEEPDTSWDWVMRIIAFSVAYRVMPGADLTLILALSYSCQSLVILFEIDLVSVMNDLAYFYHSFNHNYVMDSLNNSMLKQHFFLIKKVNAKLPLY